MQSKLRKVQAELAEAEERAELAESSLSRAAGRNRPAASAGRAPRSVSLLINLKTKFWEMLFTRLPLYNATANTIPNSLQEVESCCGS